MNERRSTLAEVAERIRKSPRWLRGKLRTLPPVGDRFGQTWTFTAAQERTLIALLQREHEPRLKPTRSKAVRWQGNSRSIEALLERLSPAPKVRSAAKAAATKKAGSKKRMPKPKSGV